MREFKPVNRGLWDAMDPAFSPDGSLKAAQNCRYRPGSTTLWQAEGRAMAGSAAGVTQIAGLAWDPPYKPELVYWDGAEYQIWPAAVSPTDVGFGTSTDFNNIGYGLGNPPESPWEIVAVPGGFLLLDGTVPKFIFRVTQEVYGHTIGERSISKAGRRTISGYKTKANPAISLAEGSVITLNRVAGSSTLSPYLGYTYWAVFTSNPLETSSTTAPGDLLIYGTPFTGGCGAGEIAASIQAGFDASTGDIEMRINVTEEEFADTSWKYLAVYRNKDGTEVGAFGTTPIPSAFPNGIQIGMVPKTSAYWFHRTDPVTGGKYWQLYIKESQVGLESTYETKLPFESVIVSAAGRTTGASRDDSPPKRSNTGDLFLDCVLLNDLDNPRKLVYSFPGLYQQFPSALYFLTMNSSDNDKITAIRSLGEVCMVLTSTSAWRINSLPTSADFDFSHGEVQTLLGESLGCPRPQAATKAHLPAPFGTVCCWVSPRGIYASNGFEIQELTSHIDWKKLNVKLDNCNLVDDPTEHRLVFHDGNSNLYYLHYHPAHVTDGVLAITGPITRPGGVSHLFRFYTEGGLPQVASLDAVGHLMYEGLNNMDEATGDSVVMLAETKEYYPGGIGAAGSVPKVMTHVAAIPVLNGTYAILVQQGPDADHLEYSQLEQITRQLFVSSKNIFTETLTFQMAGSGSQDFGVNAVGWDWDDHGTT